MRVLLVRHATCDPVGHALAGRAPGVRLNDAGRRQATRLGERLRGEGIVSVQTSPLERAVETARVIASATGAPVEEDPRLVEIDFGEWTGRTLASLEGDPHWTRFNAHRSATRPPGGELAVETQARIVAALDELGGSYGDGAVVVVSHADVIRAAIAHLLGMSLDLQHRVAVDPASISTFELQPWGPRALRLNEVVS